MKMMTCIPFFVSTRKCCFAQISEKDCQLQDLHAELEAEKTCIEELRNKIKEAEAELDMSARSFHNSNELLKEEKLKRENLQNQLTDMEQQIVVLSTAHEERVKDLESQVTSCLFVLAFRP